MKKSIKVLIAFVLGQAVQIVLHAVSMNFWENRRIAFCVAGGFLIAVALFAGCWINREGGEHLSYQDYANGKSDS